MAYDTNSYELAGYFLRDEPTLTARAGDLAQAIQGIY